MKLSTLPRLPNLSVATGRGRVGFHPLPCAVLNIPSASQIKAAFPTEEALCTLFTQNMESLGWTVYPETGGFDLLLVWEPTGHQLGVEAKLSLNAKVVDQIIPDDFHTGEVRAPQGPDFRAVIVPCLTDASKGLAKALKVLGISVFDVGYSGNGLSFLPSVERYIGQGQWSERDLPIYWDTYWHDFNPEQRCTLPPMKPNLRAGIPSPIKLSPWKVGALKVLADLQIDGFVTARSVRLHGIDPRRFCSTDGWLKPLGDGKWGLGNAPRFDLQHPDEFSVLLGQAKQARNA